MPGFAISPAGGEDSPRRRRIYYVVRTGGDAVVVALLFDLDGTLVRGAGAGARAMRDAVRQWLGGQEEIPAPDTAGQTDLYLFRDLLARAGVSYEAPPPDLIELYVERLREEVSRAPGTLLPGVRDVLERSRGDGRFRLALATGNIEEGARIKLDPHGLNPFFPVGGYGSDSADRAELVATALERVRRREGDGALPGVVIGDTPRDVAAARANGLPCVAVATGSFSAAALEEAGAEWVLADLSDGDAFFRAVRACL